MPNSPKCRLDTIPTDLIDPGNRARKDYKDIASLASDIKNRGLIHPIAVMEDSKGGYVLLAGGRRLAATQHAEIPTIDCKIFPFGLSDLERKSIELMENVMREDLSYVEKVKLQREVLRLQQTIHGKKTTGSPYETGISPNDVANMLGISREKLRQDVELANTIDKFPELGWEDLKTRADALKLKSQISQIVVRQDAIKRFEAEVGKPEASQDQQKRYLKRLSDSYIMGDFFEFVGQVPSNSIDLVEIDPPYAIKLDKVKKREGLSSYSYGETGYNEIQADDYVEFLNKTIENSVRVMAEHSWLLCWFGPEPWFSVVLDILRRNKLQVRAMPCIWAKGEPDETGLVEQTSGQTLSPMRHLANAYEMFFYAKKGDPRINRQGRTNIFGYKTVPAGQKIHPTERPKELMKDILTTFVPEGSKILVPFAGSGNTLLAAYESQMTAVGFDLGVEHKEAYVARLVS